MTEIKLNLARKWRSQQFDQVIGQELCVRMLKNSLYLGHFFPVYLFSGQRGCGKTTAARIFAAALNCKELPTFQKTPQQSPVPCLVCDSCVAMKAGNHPDFIEIDAASHTGVDNVRQIIEASALLPVMGGKKIYLIDEAHMLSRAAFNAFLKILEEPPMSVLFILATTDPHKIIPTVTSRCFQLFFKPVQEQYLVNHLVTICKQERIRYDQAGIELIVRETQGSVRDAINMLEQVRFSSSAVTKQAVLQVLGHLDDGQLIALWNAVIMGTPGQVVRLVHEQNLAQYSAEFLWQRVIAVIRAMIWLKFDVSSDQFVEYSTQLKALAQQCTVKQLQQMLGIMYEHEMPFLKTTAQHTMLELVLLQCNQLRSRTDQEGGAAPAQQAIASDAQQIPVMAESDEDAEEDTQEDEEDSHDALMAMWHTFVQEVDRLHEPLVASVFKQGNVIAYEIASKQLTVVFPKELAFFTDKIEELRAKWAALLTSVYARELTLQLLFTKDTVTKQQVEPVRPVQYAPLPTKPQPAPQQKQAFNTNFQQQRRFVPKETNPTLLGPAIDISDATQWPKAQLISSFFPGTVTEIMPGGN